MATRRQTQDEKFAESYSQRSSAQPSTGGISRIRKSQKTTRSQRNIPRQQVTYQDTVRKTRIEKPQPSDQREAAPKQKDYKTMPRYQRRLNTRLKIRAKKLPGKKADLLDRAKATSINVGIWSWAVPLWLIFQLPFAIINIVLFGLASIWLEFFGKDTIKTTDESGVVTKVVVFFWNGVKYAADKINAAINDFFGFDIAAFLESIQPDN